MKVVIGYSPFDNSKGRAFLGQNRQFQWGESPWTAYPMVPAYAASLLKQNGYQVYWLDGIWGMQNYEQWEKELLEIGADVLMLETKTPVVKRHWEIIEKLKAKDPELKIVLVGDHVTALPEESMQNCPVDYIATGGDYDFLLLNICNHISKGEDLEPGIWHRKNSKLQNPNDKTEQASDCVSTGNFVLNHNLDELPFIDRDLTKWDLYAYKNANYARVPGTYTMFGRDCWWGKCTFCLTGDVKLQTKGHGSVPIKQIVEQRESYAVKTHQGRYREITDWHARKASEILVQISSLYLPQDLKLTADHRVYTLSREDMSRCSKKNSWSYWCKPRRISKWLDCDSCEQPYFENYSLSVKPAKDLKKGDFLAVPIDRGMKDKDCLKVLDVLEQEPVILSTQKKIADKTILKILELNAVGLSQRAISRKLSIDRETVQRYIAFETLGTLDEEENPISKTEDGISFKGGVHKIPEKILLNEKFLYLAGLYIAEGHVSYQKSRPNSTVVCWTFSKHEHTLIEETANIFEACFGIELHKSLNEANNTVQLYVGSTIIARFFEILFGKGCYDKKIPELFWRFPLEKQCALLRGVFEGDGHLRKRENKEGGAEYSLSITANRAAEQIFFMLLRFDVIPSFRIVEPREKNEATKYIITLSRKDILRVFPEISFSQESITHKKGLTLDNFALVPITKIEKNFFEGYVYNVTVAEDHTYVANMLAVKNCSWTTLFPGAQYRVMSPQRALDEVGHIVENYPVKEIMDDSGTFPVGDWLREFCKGMIDRGYSEKVRISCNMRFNSGLDKEDYELMRKAGFRFILYGLESANQETLDRINKNLKVEQIEPQIRMAKEAGLNPHPTAMVGYPWETREDAERTLNMAREFFKNGYSDSLQATIVTPYPGTPLFKEAEEKGWLKTKDWDKYDMHAPVLETPMSDDELKELVRSFYKSFWSPQFVWRKIKEGLSDWDMFKYYLRFGRKFVSKLIDFK